MDMWPLCLLRYVSTRATTLCAKEIMVMVTATVYGYLATNSTNSKVKILLKLLLLLVDKREDNMHLLT